MAAKTLQTVNQNEAAFSAVSPVPRSSRLMRLRQIVGDPKADPPIPARVPVSRSAWWAGVKKGTYPAPIKLSPRVTCWFEEDITALTSRRSKTEAV
jgi:predicted DNA-binding transcriptional regulator AlpA